MGGGAGDQGIDVASQTEGGWDAGGTGEKMSDAGIQDTINRMVEQFYRVPCSKVLLSSELHRACLDEITERYKAIVEFDPLPAISGNVVIRGVPAEKCESLSGIEYALVPKERKEPR
jgi:hypothetical protein